MTEKEIDQQFKTTFKSLFPKLKNATCISEYLSEKKGKVGVALRLKVGEKKETILCEVVSQSFPKQIRKKGFGLSSKGLPVRPG